VNGPALLELLVSTPSVSGSEQQLADRLTGLLTSNGFAVQRDGANLWFSLGGEARPHLVFVSHIDTVPPCAGWNSEPDLLRRDGEKLIGLGANDAKGCVAAMILAARELQLHEKLEARVTFAFVVEEETSGAGIRATKLHLQPIDAAIVGEPTALEICTSQRGMLLLRCIAHGCAAHAAHAQRGENAIFKAARDIARLSAMEFQPQVTQISGGTARNQLPDRCEFFVDLRTTPNLEHEEVVARLTGELESEVVPHSTRYEPVATDEEEPIVRAALAAAGKSGGVSSTTTSDWAFLKGIPAVKAGPGDTSRSHTPNEYLLESELAAGAALYAQLARNYIALMKEEAAHV
jgi:acetylornithine deacetylase